MHWLHSLAMVKDCNLKICTEKRYTATVTALIYSPFCQRQAGEVRGTNLQTRFLYNLFMKPDYKNVRCVFS